jgi:hypothetical protein
MIQYDEVEETRKFKIPGAIVCDLCGKTLDYLNEDDEVQSYNFVHIRKEFGYGSEIGDEEEVSIDICEQCFIEKFGVKKC